MNAIGSFIIGESAIGAPQSAVAPLTTSEPVTYDLPTWAIRLINTQPPQWFSDNAKAPGGNLYGLFYALGSMLSQMQQGLLFAYDATYVNTAVGTYLDMAVADYYGGTLDKYPGESDAVYSSRALAGLISPAATKAALYKAMLIFTGLPPTIVQPWDMSTTGAYGYGFFDVPVGSSGGLRYSTNTPYECLVIVQFAGAAPLGGDSVTTYDDGAFFGASTMMYADLPLAPGGSDALFDTILRVVPEGVSVWVQILG